MIVHVAISTIIVINLVTVQSTNLFIVFLGNPTVLFFPLIARHLHSCGTFPREFPEMNLVMTYYSLSQHIFYYKQR